MKIFKIGTKVWYKDRSSNYDISGIIEKRYTPDYYGVRLATGNYSQTNINNLKVRD